MEALFDPPYRTGLCMMISLKKLKRQHWMHLPPSSSLTHSPKAPPSFITGLPQALSRSRKFKNWYNSHMSLAYVTLKMLHWNCANNFFTNSNISWHPICSRSLLSWEWIRQACSFLMQFSTCAESRCNFFLSKFWQILDNSFLYWSLTTVGLACRFP